MKVLKKAKIVNICLNSSKPSTPTIHLAHNHSADLSPQQLLQAGIINHCYSALTIISQHKKNSLIPHKKPKHSTDPLKQNKKTDQEAEVRLPMPVAETIQVILKRFIRVKADEVGPNPTCSPQKKKMLKKGSQGSLLFHRKSKQYTQPSVCNPSQEDEYLNIFQSTGVSLPNQKLRNKVQQLQKQSQFYKQKIASLTSNITKLEARQFLMRKRYQEEVVKIIRSKNIVNIHSQFEKERENEGNYLLNVNGRTAAFNLTSKTNECSPRCHTTDQSRPRKNTGKVRDSSDFFKKYQPNSSAIENYTINYKQTQKILSPQPIKINVVVDKELIKSTKVIELRKSLDEMQKEREKIFDQLSNMSVRYQNDIESLDQKIIDQVREIRREEELLTEDELKILKDQQFENLEMKGFYENEES